MTINEAGLTRGLKRAFRAGGYTVARNGDNIWLLATDWYVECTKDLFPRRALGAIVEHIGFLPDAGEAYHVIKNDDPQMVLFEETEQQREMWTGAAQTMDAVRTNLTYKGVRIFQALGGLEGNAVFGAPEPDLALLEPVVPKEVKAIVADRSRLLYYEDEERVVLAIANKNTVALDEKDTEILEALEHMDLRPNRTKET